jgi:hypothetical protein
MDINQTKIHATQAKENANLKKMKEEMTARLEDMIQANQEKIMVKLDAHHGRTEDLMEVS